MPIMGQKYALCMTSHLVTPFSNYNFSKYSFFELHFFLDKVFSNNPIFKKTENKLVPNGLGGFKTPKTGGGWGGGVVMPPSALHLPLGWGKGQLVEGIGCVS